MDGASEQAPAAGASAQGRRHAPASERSLEELLRGANAGDDRAYRAFLRQVTPLIRGVARRRGGILGADAIEDVVQETLIALHQKRHTWREDRPVRPWLHAIVRFKVADAFRARGQRITVQIDDVADVLPAAPSADPTERGDVDRVVGALDRRAARVVRGIGIEGASAAELGAALHMTETGVRVAFHRGLKKLAALRGCMVELGPCA